INAAAIARPEYAEDEQDLALAVNARAVETLARAAKDVGAALLHISTDHVFDGSQTRPYTETDHAAPLNMYGATKLLGEELAQLACPRTAILRTSSLHAPWGRNQIVTTFAKAERGAQVRAAADRITSPTSAEIFAETCMAVAPSMIDSDPYSDIWGVTHVSAHGECSDSALLAQALGSAGFNPDLIAAQRMIDWPTTAAYPRSTPLDCTRMVRVFGIQPRPWQEHLERTLAALRPVETPEAA
ncbi:MAG: sugar nucleotide-binding protein, partial [Pseudomonadota bacterium]